MYHTRPKKKDSRKVVIDAPAARTGHRSHRSGAGVHADKRTKRCRTRAAQNKVVDHD